MIALVSPPPVNVAVNARRWPPRAPADPNFVALYKGLVSHWRMYDSEGELVQHEDDGPAKILLNATTGGDVPTFAFTGQVASYSVHLNQAGYFAANDTGKNLNPTGGSFTWRVRVRLDSTFAPSTHTVLSYGDDVAGFKYMIWYDGSIGTFKFQARTPTDSFVEARAENISPVVAGTWYCLFCSFDAVRRKISIRAYPGPMFVFNPPPLAIAYETTLVSMPTGAAQFRFGATTWGGAASYQLKGNISHMLFYNRLLNSTEETILACSDYASFPGYVAAGISAPPPAIPAAPAMP